MKSGIALLTVISFSWMGSLVQATDESSPGTQLSKHLYEDIAEQQSHIASGARNQIKPQDSQVQSIIVKRAARPYSFGLGKKSMSSVADMLNEARSRQQSEQGEGDLNSILSMYYDDGSSDFDTTLDGSAGSDKRSSGPTIRGLMASKPGMTYSFGLGKRSNGWIGKISSLPEPAYLGDIKRRYSFGLGK